jgi:uncharacterized protein YprB with RNaseH-like and TPR domain
LSSLADRIRGIVKPQPDAVGTDDRSSAPQSEVTDVLGGEWRDSCLVVERRLAPAARHGREQVGDVAARCSEAAAEARVFAAGSVPRPPFCFFDLETTGLSGGAGTHAFLVGCGWFDDRHFVTRQFVLTRFADERPMLDAVARACTGAGALVTFNGKSFDAPLLETRFLYHRIAWFGGELPHVDVLHPARQFWKRDDCSLLALEQHLLGHRRTGDVPGFEIPRRYFQFVRSGDARPLRPVLEHNRLDLLSLAALTARLFDLARRGPDAAGDAREALALGHAYARADCDEKATAAYAKAIAMSRAPRGAFDATKIEALRALALACRRMRRFDDAARWWSELLEIRGCPPHIAKEAAEALAIHHEHRLRDFASAKWFAMRSLESAERAMRPAWTQAVRHRVARIERKIGDRLL